MVAFGYSETDGLVSGATLAEDVFPLDEDTFHFFETNVLLLNFTVVDNKLCVNLNREALEKMRVPNQNFIVIDGMPIFDDEYPLIAASGGSYYTRTGDYYEGPASLVLDKITARNFDCYFKTGQLRNIKTVEELRAWLT